MSEQALAPIPGGGVPVTSARLIPPLPPGIGILPAAEVTAAKPAKRFPAGLLVLIIMVGLIGMVWFWSYVTNPAHLQASWVQQYDADNAAVLQAITPVMMRRAPRLTIVPVTLSSGPRLLEISFTVVHRQPGKPPSTCVFLNLLDPTTRARIKEITTTPCIAGLDYPIKQQ
jgi:hypothetical protein